MEITPGTRFKSVEAYFSVFPPTTQAILQELRTAVKQAAPEAKEMISYNMPSFQYYGMLVYYAAYDKHIGFYPTPSGIEAFKEELSAYKSAKGSVQFPIDEPLPLGLISRIVQFRVKENLAKAKRKK